MGSSEDKKPNHLLETVDIGIFHGLKVLLSIGVVLMHTMVGCVHFTIPSSMLPDREPPIVPWSSTEAFYHSLIGSCFAWLVQGVNVFWFISGFLISYQLYFIPRKYYPQFFINRLLRLYPLLIIYIVFIFSLKSPGCSTSWDILKSLLFIDNFWDSALDSGCSGSGWSLSMDIHTCIIIIVLFYLFDPKKKHIIYILSILFIASWIISIYMFHNHCFKYLSFGNTDASLIKLGIDSYYPEVLRRNFAVIDVFKYIDTNIYDPDNLSDDQIRSQILTNNYLSVMYIPTYTQIGAGFFGAITCLQLLYHKLSISKYWILFIFVVANYCFTLLGSMTTLYKDMHLHVFDFTDSILTSILYGSTWKFQTLSVFCGMNILLRMNNKYVNAVLHNRFTVFLSKYTYGVFLFHMVAIMAFTFDDEYRKSVLVTTGDSEGDLQIAQIWGKSLGISAVISMILYHLVEYPVTVWRKKRLSKLFQKQKLN